ncbi:hypothetical protein MTS1_01538 [Microbacterium sp. TS-1]|jgi:hypothetical protein|uniref:FHA domain-containing protein n=1 Tax=Microbacterium paludicola TaxID=300019 RepID=A0ABU1I350_9MICO|nr:MULTISPECIES: hypothetical protein [Microbacterium]MDR6168314.1 hypothetical protein [Microbacterium paludicola]POX68069.1 hypothetical protein C3481_07860 [Microbacterium sp. Ru50]GAD34176.1 hypothetical protein MTS1_01538 [Microbacterium sp. TS-1]
MYNDYAGPAAAFGIGFIVLGIAIYLGTIALILWVSYLLMRTAVKNGMLLAMRESGGQFPGGGGAGVGGVGGYGAGPRPAAPPYPQAPPAPGGHGAPGAPGGPAAPGAPGGPASGGPASGGPSPVG